MNRTPRRLTITLAAAALTLAATAARATEPAARPVTYLATLVDTTHVLPHGSSVPITIRLDRFSTDAEAARLEDLGKVRDERALRKALGEEFVGRIEVNGHLGDPIAFAHRFEDADGVHVLMIAQRTLSMREIFDNWPTVDYPYTVLQIDLGADGTGSGTLYAAARIRPRKDGEIELVGFDFLPSRLMAVKAVS